MRLFLICLIICFLVSSCSRSSNTVHLAEKDESLVGEYFPAFIPSKFEFGKLKGIPKEAVSRLNQEYDKYLQQVKASETVLNLGFNGMLAVKLEAQREYSQTLVAAYMDEFLKREITDERVRRYYEENQDHYVDSEFEISHLLIKKHDKMSKTELEAIAKKADAIRAESEKAIEFEDLVLKYSEDKSTLNQRGLLGRFSSKSLASEVYSAIAVLDIGEVSDFVETPRGFQMFKVLSRDVNTIPLEEVRDQVKYELKRSLSNRELERLAAKAH